MNIVSFYFSCYSVYHASKARQRVTEVPVLISCDGESIFIRASHVRVHNDSSASHLVTFPLVVTWFTFFLKAPSSGSFSN